MDATTLERLSGEVTRAIDELRGCRDVPASVEAFVDQLDEELRADAPLRGTADPYLTATLFAGALRAVKALRHDNAELRCADLRLALEQVRQSVRDMREGQPYGWDVPVGEILHRLARELAVPQRDLAELLATSTRQLQRWLADGGSEPGDDEASRIRGVAYLVGQLRHSFTDVGVVAWFRRPHPELGRPPADLLADPLQLPHLQRLAAAARSAPGA